MYYLNCFFVYSILGYILETVMALITKSGFKSGFFYGPITPVYGIGSVIILLLSHYFFLNLHLPRWIETIIVFFILAIFLMCLELLGGITIEKLFNITFWDYSSSKLSIGKYISWEMTLIWGVATVIFIYLINPLFEKLIHKIPTVVTIILSIAFIIDVVITIINKLKK